MEKDLRYGLEYEVRMEIHLIPKPDRRRYPRDELGHPIVTRPQGDELDPNHPTEV